jgi:mono/diheme cytochrome c family protein
MTPSMRPFWLWGVPAVCGWLLCSAAAARAADAAQGRHIYVANCAFCHGMAGKGDGPAAAALKPPPTNFANRDFWTNGGADRIKSAIADGKPGTAMMAYKASLSSTQIDDLSAYLQTFKPQP